MKIKNLDILFSLLKVILILLTGSLFVYGFDFELSNTIFYTTILLFFLFSKNLPFWSAVLFIMISNPWGLFYWMPYNWIIKITSTVGISYLDAFSFVFLIKIITQPNFLRQPDLFVKLYKPVIIYVVFLIIWGSFIGHSLRSAIQIIQYLPPFLLFYIVPRLFNPYEISHFNRIIFLFTIIHTVGSILDIVTAGDFLNFLTYGKDPTGVVYRKGLIRIVGGIIIHLYTMIIGLYYLSIKSSDFKPWYLWFLILFSWFFIMNSATRGWMIASTFVLISYVVYNLIANKFSSVLRGVVFSLIFGITLFLFIPSEIKTNLKSSYERLTTIEAIAEGDITAEGSLQRLEVRGPRVLSRFNDSPVFGFGYSKVTADLFDPHVGNHDLLLIGGIFGLSILWITVSRIVFRIYRIERSWHLKGSIIVGIGIISIMIIHSTSRNMISFYMPVDSAFLFCLLLNHINSATSYGPFSDYQIKLRTAKNLTQS